jgi:hypothetical protein
LGTPKWSLNCPPVTRYLKRLTGATDKPFVLFVVHSNRMSEGYLRALAARVRKKGGSVLDTFTLRADHVRSGAYEAMVGNLADRLRQRWTPPVPPERCTHRFSYYGVTNLVWRGELLGNLDVWRCQSCYVLDVAVRGVGRVEDDALGFHPPTSLDAEWRLYVCTAREPPSWGVQLATGGVGEPHSCQAKPAKEKSPGSQALVYDGVLHWVWPVREVVNRSIELG